MTTDQTTTNLATLPKELDIAIIGGGVAGGYIAYRLMAAKPETSPVLSKLKGGKNQLNVGLFEVSDRIGGRLWSLRHNDYPDIPSNHPAELGGQGFSFLHKNVRCLLRHLGFEAQIRPSQCFNNPLIHYLRRHRFYDDQYSKSGAIPIPYSPAMVPYFLECDEKDRRPDDLVRRAIEEGIQGPHPESENPKWITGKDLYGELAKELEDAIKVLRYSPDAAEVMEKEYFQAMRKMTMFLQHASTIEEANRLRCGIPLHQHGWWNFLLERLSGEAYTMALQNNYTYSDFRNQNLYDACLSNIGTYLSLLLLGPQDPYFFELSNGYQCLPEELERRFRRLGGQTYGATQLYGLQRDGGAYITLQVGRPQRAWEQPSEVIKTTVRARYVVLALPQRALQSLDPNSFIFENRPFRMDIESVTAAPASKVFFCYDNPWWKHDLNEDGGYSTTDLPIRACYYVGSDHGGPALLVASLSDNVMSSFWNDYFDYHRSSSDRLEPAVFKTDSLHAFLACLSGAGQHERKQEGQLALMAWRQLEEMHGDPDIPKPKMIIFQDWSRSPFGGGWHNWRPWVKSWEVMPRIRKPVEDANIFLCGEAYSAQQGWVEGALNTAEKTLMDHFGLPKADWIPSDYEVGP